MKQSYFVYFIVGASIVMLGAKGWQSELPKVAKESVSWTRLVSELKEEGLYFGALAASKRILSYFNDLETKQAAYKTIIELIDQGYPFMTRKLFVIGDIDPQVSYQINNSYNLYKGMINRDKKLAKWAKHYFSQVDKINFPKYLFYKAVESYQKKKLDQAIDQLRTIMKMDLPITYGSFSRKVARTLARIYFEKENYKRSLEIYQKFILKFNPIEPSDWIEAAWNLYFLNRHSEALGHLYNLESRAVDDQLHLDRFVIRALIYRELCASDQIVALLSSFDQEFGSTINGIKRGKSLGQFKELERIQEIDHSEYYEMSVLLKKLGEEETRIDKMSSDSTEIAKYLYRSEFKRLSRERRLHYEPQMRRAAESLVMISEALRFLKFEVAREKFNPDVIFTSRKEKKLGFLGEVFDDKFNVHWVQMGDFWRDERLNYSAAVSDQCNDSLQQ